MRTRQTILILMLAFMLGVFAARLPGGMLAPGGPGYAFMDPIIEVFDTINERYVDNPDLAKLQTGTIDGMLEALDDPYTQYIPPANKAEFQKELTGQFVGIGAEVAIQGGYLTILSPIEDSPAYNAGIKANDRVIEIEGKTTLNMPIDECIAKLTGAPGTPVNILIERGGPGGQRIPMTIVRQHIIVRAVKGIHREAAPGNGAGGNGNGAAADGHAADAHAPERAPRWDYLIDHDNRIGYIRLTQFTPTAAQELGDALVEINAQRPESEGGLRGLILDLRGNPGGVLETAVAITDLFIKEGVIVSVKGRGMGGAGGAGDEVHRAKADGTLPDFPLVVLVNGGSASASEIVSGALSDHNRAIVLGTRTFGKGLVQAVQTLRYGKGAQLKFTTQRYYLPSGRLIQRTDQATTWGVDPTPGYYVPLTEDEQLARLLERRERDILGVQPHADAPAPSAENPDADAPAQTDEPERWSDPAWIESSLKDKQLAAALKAVQGRIGTGEWTPVSDAVEQVENINLTELTQLQHGRERVLRELARVERRIESLEAAAAGDAKLKTQPTDLWPNEINLAGGRIDVYDKDGKKISTLEITGPNLERWLIDADVKPAEGDGAPGAAPSSDAKPNADAGAAGQNEKKD